MSNFKDYREESKKNWGVNTDGNLDREQVQTGCLLRIADATEKMAVNYTNLQNQLENYKRWHKQECDRVEALKKKVKALRGHNTRLRNENHRLKTQFQHELTSKT